MNFTDLNQYDGIQFMPVLPDKRPIHKSWESIKTKYDYTNAQAAGIVCGSISGNLEGIDFDLKYDLTGTLMDDYIAAVNHIKPGLINKLVVQRTKNNGFHLIYRCAYIQGNLKLANRDTTVKEKNETYQNTFAKKYHELGASMDPNDPKFQEASVAAKKAMDADKVRVLIETRGEKGYIACAPTPGYELVQGNYGVIPEITMEERDILFEVAFSFNSYFPKKEPRPNEIIPRKNIKGLTPSEDFNNRGDVVDLLCKHGWTVTGRKGHKVLMRRPGDTKALTSGNYDEELKWFSVFSTSTEFESQKPYKPYAVFAMLECNGDYSAVTKKLADLGYGDPLEKVRDNMAKVPSFVDTADDDDMSFLATEEDFNDYLDRWMNGTFEMGKSTGIPKLDNHFLFKSGNLVINNGIDNVGKSIVSWYLLFLSVLLHGWKPIIFSSENKVGAFKKKIMEFYLCKPLKAMSPEEYSKAKKFFDDNFRVIKNGKDLYNYQDIVNMVIKIRKIFPANALLIDPYNSLVVESKDTYQYHYQTASYLKLFAEQTGMSIWLNAHVTTGAAKKKDDNGFTMAPQKEDTEMGVMFANKADDFITTHRQTQHATDYIYTELHVRKIKEMETGGRPTPLYAPVYFRALGGLVGFTCVDKKNSADKGFNPVEEYWRKKEGQVDVFSFPSPDQFIEPVAIIDDEELPF